MEHYAGIDVSLEQSSVCVVDATGRIVREAKVASEPEALVRWFAELALPLARIGLGSGPLSPSGDYRRPLLCRRIERAALDGSMRACGRRGWLSSCWRPGMCATRSRRCRSRPTGLRGTFVPSIPWHGPDRARDRSADATWLVPAGALQVAAGAGNPGSADSPQAAPGQAARCGDEPARDLAWLRPEGGRYHGRTFETRIRELVAEHPTLGSIGDALLAAHHVLARELHGLETSVRRLARADKRARLLMSAPGVGSIVALTYVAAIDDPGRFRSSKAAGAHFGLTPKRYQSGETDVTGRISKIGDAGVRATLYEAAHVILTRPVKGSALKSWALRVASRSGMRKAKAAPSLPPSRHRFAARTGSTALPSMARKLTVVLHRMLADNQPFGFGKAAAAAG